MSASRINSLSVITHGHVHAEALEPLTRHLSRLEQVVTNLEPRVAIAEHRAEINRAIDAAANDWVLIMREREMIDERLAAEIAGAGDAWGYRIRTTPMYAGRPLRISGDGELRLFHRRHLLRREWNVEGPTIRFSNAFHAITFESAQQHREYLATHATPQSPVRRMMTFLANARTLDGNTLRYIWIEAGFTSS
jgi:hypothetical protein